MALDDALVASLPRSVEIDMCSAAEETVILFPGRQRMVRARHARQWRSFVAARAFVHTLELTNRAEWYAYCRSLEKPRDIPRNSQRTYASEWQDWGDWLGTGTVANRNREFRPFAEAREFVHQLGLKNQEEWHSYCRSPEKPRDIPRNPGRTYASGWQTWGDWLGTGTVASRDRKFRPFAKAREFVHQLGLKNQEEWHSYCRSPEKPRDIPSHPGRTYASGWQSWGDWLGTGTVANRDRKFRPFAKAREFVHTLGLKNAAQWRVYCRSSEKPHDIPSNPNRDYPSEWRSWGAWLGTGMVASRDRKFRPFAEAREFVHTLGLKSAAQWRAYCRSGRKPDDIPSEPNTNELYAPGWQGWGDWLGVINRWTKTALLVFLNSLRPNLPHLSESELYVLLQQGGQVPALRAALGGASVTDVLRDLKNNEGRSVQRAITEASGEEIATRAEQYLDADLIPTQDDGALVSTDVGFAQTPQQAAVLPLLETPDDLRVIDELGSFHYGLDEEAAEYLVMNRVVRLWERYINEGRAGVNDLLAGDGGRWFREIKARFLAEVDGVERLEIPSGWSFTKNGELKLPNLMQRYAAWAVRERRRVGNWSGIGSGKTLSAILAARVVNARRTLVVTNNATVGQWATEIKKAYPDSVVHEAATERLRRDDPHYHWLVLNYEKFQIGSGSHLVRNLLAHAFDFIVLDEVQFVKQRDTLSSKRRTALTSFITNATERNPHVRVLGMSATPVINNLLEAKKLLETTTGVEFDDLGTQATINNALAVHRALMLHGVRYRPPYEQEVQIIELPIIRNDLLHNVRASQGQVLALEQVFLPAKMEATRQWFGKGTLVYSHYVDGMIAPARQFLERVAGLRVGLYTGIDKTGLDDFLKGRKDILLASSPVGTGLDGLQEVCHRLVFLSLPWTSAEYEQIIGRLRRQGSRFREVEIVIPQVVIEHEGSAWSWDRKRLEVIHYKRTLSDCALDGQIPETIRMSPTALLSQSREALERWIARLEEQGVLLIERRRLKVPLPPDVREAARARHGDFGAITRRWNVSSSQTTHRRLQLDPSEWYLYHTLYRETRATWPEHPVDHIAERIATRPDWVVGDFGCGECLLRGRLTNRVIGIDHVAFAADVIECDMASTPLESRALDVAVFSLSLMGTNWIDYLKEAHRILKPFGYLVVAEPLGRWRDDPGALRSAVESSGFSVVGEIEQRYEFIYLTALRE
jgi:3-mercaptopyruvate sulfurtransferase SseA